MQDFPFDPWVLGYLAAYAVAVGGLGLLLVGSRIASRGAAFDRLKQVLGAAKQMGGAWFAPLPGGKHGEFVVYAKGKYAASLPSARELEPVSRAALVKDHDGQTGLVLTAGGKTIAVSGIEPVARILEGLHQDGVPIAPVLRDDEGRRIEARFKALALREQEMLGRWLAQGEIITDIVPKVDYEGKLKTAGAKGNATLVVTNLRAGLLAQTVLSEQVGNQMRTTTSFNLISYPLPLAKEAILERTASLGESRWTLRLELPDELKSQPGAADVPALKLGQEHAGLLLPLVLFKRPVRVLDAGAGFGRVIAETIGPALGCGILLAIPAGVAAGIAYGQRTYNGRYLIPVIAAALLTPAWFKLLTLLDAWFERSRTRTALPE